jgi:hypothetical protein
MKNLETRNGERSTPSRTSAYVGVSRDRMETAMLRLGILSHLRRLFNHLRHFGHHL